MLLVVRVTSGKHWKTSVSNPYHVIIYLKIMLISHIFAGVENMAFSGNLSDSETNNVSIQSPRTRSGALGGGQETIGLTIVPFFAHHGMVFIPLGYTEPKMFSFDEPHGASPYGSGTFAGPDTSRMPSDLEKEICVSHGKHFATVAAKLAK
jgi:hypothetical protein